MFKILKRVIRPCENGVLNHWCISNYDSKDLCYIPKKIDRDWNCLFRETQCVLQKVWYYSLIGRYKIMQTLDRRTELFVRLHRGIIWAAMREKYGNGNRMRSQAASHGWACFIASVTRFNGLKNDDDTGNCHIPISCLALLAFWGLRHNRPRGALWDSSTAM